MNNLPEFEILTKLSVYNDEVLDNYELLYDEQNAKLKELGIDYDSTECCIHFFDSAWLDEQYIITNCNDAVQNLALKDGCDLVRFENGNLGYVSYYSGEPNGFEILNPYKVESFTTTDDFLKRMMELSTH